MTGKDEYVEGVKKDIIDSFLELDVGNMTPWHVYQMGVKKGIELF